MQSGICTRLNWRETDLPALGWRHRRHYDTRASFITLAIEDGADPEILENRVTHTRHSRSAFDGYNRACSGSGRVPRWRSCGSRAVRGARRSRPSSGRIRFISLQRLQALMIPRVI